MTLDQEIRQDIVDNCNIVLNLLKSFPATNDTVEGRMVYQCRWLKEQAAAGSLPLPVREYVDTLKHVSSERLLSHLASSPERYPREIGIYLYRLLYLIDRRPLFKPEYRSQAVRCLDLLIDVLRHSPRPLNQFEQASIDELVQLRQGLIDGSIEPPLMHYLPAYPNLRNVYRLYKSSVDDLPKAKWLMETVNELIFEGVRPDSWTTPAAADKTIAAL